VVALECFLFFGCGWLAGFFFFELLLPIKSSKSNISTIELVILCHGKAPFTNHPLCVVWMDGWMEYKKIDYHYYYYYYCY
jgi:hypothetical protein